jgi:hypothetical protein
MKTTEPNQSLQTRYLRVTDCAINTMGSGRFLLVLSKYRKLTPKGVGPRNAKF